MRHEIVVEATSPSMVRATMMAEVVCRKIDHGSHREALQILKLLETSSPEEGEFRKVVEALYKRNQRGRFQHRSKGRAKRRHRLVTSVRVVVGKYYAELVIARRKSMKLVPKDQFLMDEHASRLHSLQH